MLMCPTSCTCARPRLARGRTRGAGQLAAKSRREITPQNHAAHPPLRLRARRRAANAASPETARRKLGHYGDAAADYALALKAALADGPERAPAADDDDDADGGGDRRARRGDVAVAKLYNARAYCLAKMDDFHGAVDDYSAALEHDADNTHALHNRGISRDRLGLDALAMADFNRVLDIEGAVAGTAGQGLPLYRMRHQANMIAIAPPRTAAPAAAASTAADIAAVRALP